MGLRPPACWDCGVEYRRGHGCLCVVSVVCFQAEISASRSALLQRSPVECGVSECDRKASKMRKSCRSRGCREVGGGRIIGFDFCDGGSVGNDDGENKKRNRKERGR